MFLRRLIGRPATFAGVAFSQPQLNYYSSTITVDVARSGYRVVESPMHIRPLSAGLGEIADYLIKIDRIEPHSYEGWYGLRAGQSVLHS
jgi:hypothetical protein